jgi:hypothetical protein
LRTSWATSVRVAWGAEIVFLMVAYKLGYIGPGGVGR